MAAKMVQGAAQTASFSLIDLKSQAAAFGVDWAALWADIQKYGPGLVGLALTLATDAIAGQWAKIVSDLIAMGPAELVAVVAILKDLGINLPFPVTP